MLYRVFITVAICVAITVVSCKDEVDDSHVQEDHQVVVIAIEGDLHYYYEWCGPDFWPEFSALVHTEDTMGNPCANLSIRVFDSYDFEFLPTDDSIFVSNDRGNVELHFSCHCVGEFEFVVVAAQDTATYEFSINQGEGIFGSYIDPITDTLYDRPELSDSMEIRARLIYDWGFPASSDSSRFWTSSGYIDSSYQAYGFEGWSTISVYWYPLDPTIYGEITIHAETKTYCGQWPDNEIEVLIHDSTSFIFYPAP